MPIEIDLIRHGETEGNAASIWQGHGDTRLTTRGIKQAEVLGERLARRDYALVVSSDLGRAQATARLAGLDAASDPGWREADVGAWEGLTHAEVAARHPDEIAALTAGRDVRFGGGESYADLRVRAQEAFDKLVARLDHGERAAVVTHGGIVSSLVANTLGLDRNARRRAFGRFANAAITTIRLDGDHTSLAVVNDASHLGDGPVAEGSAVTLIRHGETEANAAGRWQGATDGDLSAAGVRQAAAVAPTLTGLAALYSSPLRRARRTAQAIAAAHGLPLSEHPGLGEMRFGEWEDLSPTAIAAGWPGEWQRIYVDGEDRPRGRTGESYAEVAERMQAAIAEVGAAHPGAQVGVVGHGGAIRAFVTALIGLPFPERRRLDQPRNTARCTIILDGDGSRLVDYNVAPHLEG